MTKKDGDGKLPAICAVIGTDDVEVGKIARELAAQMAPPDAGEFGSDVIDGTADNADQATDRIGKTLDALLTLPFFGGAKLVWLKGATFLGDTQTGRAAAVDDGLRHLGDLIEKGLPQDVRFLLSAFEVDKRRSFYKRLAKVGDVRVYDRLDTSRGGWEEAAESMVRTKATELGLQFDQAALGYFVQATAGDRRQIEMGLDKISLFLGGESRRIDLALARSLAPETRAAVIFELGNALQRRDAATCFELIDRLLAQKESGVGILLASVVPTVRNLLIAKGLMIRHKIKRPMGRYDFSNAVERLPADATEHLPRKKDGGVNTYGLGLAAAEAHRFSESELVGLMTACLSALEELVTSGGTERLILGKLVGKIMA
jgi:DNA polymerase-3 subunit delta